MGTDREHEARTSGESAAGRTNVDDVSTAADAASKATDAVSKAADRGCVGGQNEVVIVGRLSAAPELRELPSGDQLVTFRLVVPRAGRRESRAPKSPAAGQTAVDVIDVACWTGRTRRSALRLEAGDRARVEGALRRRFFRTGGGTASRYEVEAASVRADRSGGRSARVG